MTQPRDPRTADLLADRALAGLDDAEARELAAHGADGDDSYDLAAAAVELATLAIEPMPAAVADRIAAARHPRTLAGWQMAAPPPSGPAPVPPSDAPPREVHSLEALVMPSTQPPVFPPEAAPPAAMPRSMILPSTPPPSLPPSYTVSPTPPPSTPLPDSIPWSDAPGARVTPSVRPPSLIMAPPVTVPVVPVAPVARRRRAALPWLAAAATLVLVAGGWWLVRGRAPRAPTAAAARAELLASAGDAARIDWKATPEAPGASGDVVWSPSAQRGYLRFVGLPPNDPANSQYQLWIFDHGRDQAFPVDGGVFDVTSTGEVIVPITAKLRVDDAALFAVTVERPGGVVVSKREHIVVTAARS